MLDLASNFGKLRLINEREKLNIPFEKLSPWKYIDNETWSLKKTPCLLSDFSQLAGKSLPEITALVKSCPNKPVWKLVQGHDMIKILHIGFKKVLAEKTQLSDDEICKLLRLAYQDSDLKQTGLYSKIKEWEAIRGISILRI